MMKKRIMFFLASIDEVYSSYLNLFQENNFETVVFILEKKPSLIEKIKYVKKTISELRRFKPDFIYINDEFFTKITLLIVFCKRFFSRKSKIIVFIASRNISEPTFLNKIKLKFLLKNIDFLICRNKKELERIKKIDLFKNYPNLYQVYWGFPKELFYKKEVSFKKPNRFVLGFMGRIVPEKGLDTILDCLSKLPNNFVLLYAGKVYDHNYNSQINQFIKENNLSERVRYLGFIDYDNLNSVYNSIDLLIMSTTSKPNGCVELFGYVIAESMLAKTFVIGSDNGSIPEVIGRADFIFKQSDSNDLLRVINYVYNLSEEKKKQIIEENYQRAIKEFSSRAYVENIINIISK